MKIAVAGTGYVGLWLPRVCYWQFWNVFWFGRGVVHLKLVSSMKNVICLTLLACSLQLVSCSKDFDNSTVNEFDLSRYLGVWYEIARYDHSFERGMDNTMAEYILQDNGKVFVLNSGWKNGKFEVAEGKAVYKDPEGKPGAMKVSFFWFFYSTFNYIFIIFTIYIFKTSFNFN